MQVYQQGTNQDVRSRRVHEVTFHRSIRSPSIDQLDQFKKDELLDIGKRLELEVARSMRKANSVRLIGEHMVDNDV